MQKRELISYTWPLAAAALTFMVAGFTDTTVIAYYSTLSLAGLTLATGVYQLFSISMLSGLTAYNILLPRTTGPDGKRRSLNGLFIVLRRLLPISLIATALLATIAALVLSLVKDPIWLEGAKYLLIMAFNLPMSLLCSSLLRTAVVWGKTKYPFYALLMYAGINLVLDLLFVYGAGPIPSMGVLGSALATVIAVMVITPWAIFRVRTLWQKGQRNTACCANVDASYSSISASAFHEKGRGGVDTSRLSLGSNSITGRLSSRTSLARSVNILGRRRSAARVPNIARDQQIDSEIFAGWGLVSLPSVLSMVLDYFAALLFTLIVSTAGAELLGSARFGLYAEILSFTLIGSLSEAGVIILGRTFGSAPGRAFGESRSIIRTFLVYSIIIGVVVVALAKPVSLVVSPNLVIQDNSFFIILMISTSCPLIGWCFANLTFLRTMARTGMDFACNVIAVWLAQIPIAIAGLYLFSVRGAFLGVFAYWLFRAVLTYICVRYIRKRL